MFICIEKNPDGSHAYQHGGTMQEGWAYWDENTVSIPASFPYVDFEAEEIHHEAVIAIRKRVDESGKMVENPVVIVPEFTRKEVVSAAERKIPEEAIPEPTQLDIIEAQVTYTAMMTDTLLEV